MYNHAPKDYECPFCLIVHTGHDSEVNRSDEIIYTDDLVTAFISSHWLPNNPGHVLVVPNKHFENLYEIESIYSHRIMDVTKKMAIAIKEAYKATGTSTRQHNEPDGNQDVWHYHMHVFPRFKNDNLYLNHLNKAKAEKKERVKYANILKDYCTNKGVNIW